MSDTSLLSPALSLIATLKAELTALTAERDAIRVCFAEASHEAGPGRVRVEMELATVTKERDAALARAAEHQARLIGYLDSPEGANFVAAQQRDTANRVADELENELAAVTAERDALDAEQNLALDHITALCAERDALRAAVTQAIVWLGDTYVEGANIRIRCADVLQATLDVFAKHPEGQV